MLVTSKLIYAGIKEWNNVGVQQRNGLENQDFADLGPLDAKAISNGALDGVIKSLPKTDIWDISSGIINWADEYFGFAGKGSSRFAFKIDEDHALKVATNAAGIAQNKVESHLAQKFHDLPITKVHHMGANGLYLVVDYAHSLKLIDFQDKFKIQFYDFCVDAAILHNGNTQRKKGVWKGLSPEAKKLFWSLIRHHISLADVGSEYQWGEVKDNPVLVDYGFNNKVRQEHYL